MNDEFENALAWFTAAPKRWLASARKDLGAVAEWIWGVLQGDFNEDASTAQVATGTVISMIPFIDQICDVRDVVANCKKIHSDSGEQRHWVALILTLIGLFPTVGSLLKGCGKVAFSSIRAGAHISGVAPKIAEAIEFSVVQLNKFLARPAVRKTLKSLKIDNPYKYLSVQFRKLATQVSVAKLLKAFDEARQAANSLLQLVKKYGGSSLATRASALMELLQDVRKAADKPLAWALKPVQNFLDRLARRLDLEADLAHRAHLNALNPHSFARVTDAAEEAEFKKHLPTWADAGKGLKNKPLSKAPVAPDGWRSTMPDPKNPHPMDNAHTTFKTMKAVTIPPGETLYRVIAPNSSDNSICWMRKAEFDKLKSKSDWRRRFAVWVAWNRNGEFVTYTVPPGKGLNVWEGITASQEMKGNSLFTLEGGAIQLVVNPDDLKKSGIGKRKLTNWGYDVFGSASNLIGVPTLTNNWYEKK
jgi:hypothetical protein